MSDSTLNRDFFNPFCVSGNNVKSDLELKSIKNLLNAELENPRGLLGPQVIQRDGQQTVSIRTFQPDSKKVWVCHGAHHDPKAMKRIHPTGLFEATIKLPQHTSPNDYRFQVAYGDGQMNTMHDPYSFESYFSDLDLHLFGEGTNIRVYEKLGAQLRTIDDVQGVNFAVWAPNAKSVSVVGDFNEWDARHHAMSKSNPNGIWEIFIPQLEPGVLYKYRVKTADGRTVDKTDPYGYASEMPPRTASIVTDLDHHHWNDAEWMRNRREQNQLEKPISVYEVHLGSWRRTSEGTNGWKNYRDLAHELVEYCLQQNYTHVELMPVSEHPFTGSWGYQTIGYFAATSRYGTPEDFMYFVDHFHQNGLGVILDWVPAHFPKDEFGLARYDGTALYEHEDPRKGEHPDWGTLIFNYGRNEVRNFLLSNAIYWLDKFHIDGLRVDAVASMLYLDYSRNDGEWIPNEQGGRENLEAIDFLKQFNEVCHAEYPGVLTIAEESTSFAGVSTPTFAGGLGFSLKWNMGWMNDTLRFMSKEPVHRQYHHGELTFSLVYAFSENFMLPFSHDEVVHGKKSILDQMPGDLWQKFANLRLLYSYMWTHPGKKLLFMGSDFGQWLEFDHDSEPQWELLEHETHQGILKLVADLNKLYRSEPALYELDFDQNGFEWIDCHNQSESILSYARRSKDGKELIVASCNFTPVVREEYRVGVPQSGSYREIFNSDSMYYGGTNVGNFERRVSERVVAQGRDESIAINIPPLGMTVMKLES